MVRWLDGLMVKPLEAPEEMREEQMVEGVEAKTPRSANYKLQCIIAISSCTCHLYIVTELCRHRHAFKNVLL